MFGDMSSRRPLSTPIWLAIGMISLLVVLTVGWALVTVFGALKDSRTAGLYWALLTVGSTFILLLLLTQRPAQGKRRPVILLLARLLRRTGRWLWALGEAVEIGFFHGRRVRDRISLDLDPTESGGQR